MAWPKTRKEALARGFKRLGAHKATRDLSAFLDELGNQPDCSDPANAGNVCGGRYDPDTGRLIVLTCQGGARAQNSALIAPEE